MHFPWWTRVAGVALILDACGPGRIRPGEVTQHWVADSAVRIERVLHGLRPRIEVLGSTPVRWSLGERMAAYHVPGVSIAMIDSGRIVWAAGFGVKEAGRPDSVTTTTIFQAASISKPIAVTAMLRLVDTGKLTLDANVNQYLTSWKLPENHFTAEAPVTLRRLASHNAATTVGGFPGYEVGQPLPTIPELLDGKPPANNKPVRVDTIPGTKFTYSGGGTTIMQQVLVDATGTPFPVLLRQQVFDPTGMRYSTFEQPLPDARVDDAASAHDRRGAVIRGRWRIHPEMAAAGLWTTPSDLATWAIAIAGARTGRSNSFLSQTTTTEMFSEIPGRVARERVGLGLFIYGAGNRINFSHGGENVGFISQLVMYPATGQGAVIMTNGDNGVALIQEVLYAIGAEYGRPSDGPFPQTVKVKAFAVDSSTLSALVGDYAIDFRGRRLSVGITREGSQLFFLGSWATLREELYPLSLTSFITASTARQVKFARDDEGRTVIFVQDRPGVVLTGTKQ